MNEQTLEHIHCNLCGANKPITIYPSRRNVDATVNPNEFRSSGDEPLQDPLVKCTVCGFKYVTPRLKPELVLDGYINAIDETFVSQAKGREATFRRCLSIIQGIWKKAPGGILDIGTANGSFLKVAKDAGWAVEGCEPNLWMCDWCNDNYGIQLKSGTVFDVNFNSETFDVVTLWDVIEHTPDPMETLRECERILRVGGLLVVNYPDIGSWVARAMKQKWVFLLSVHYFYFTKKTIRKVLEKNNFKIEAIKPHFQTLELDYILFRSISYIGIFGKILRFLVRFIGLRKLQIPYWVGQTLVIATKKGEKI